MKSNAAGRISLRRVLAATDFSPISLKALHHAISIAHRYQAKFYIVHVVSSWGFNVAGYDAAVEASKLAYNDLQELATRLIKGGALKDVDHEIIVAIGDFWEEIKYIATTQEIDLVVLGTHGRVGIEKIVMVRGRNGFQVCETTCPDGRSLCAGHDLVTFRSKQYIVSHRFFASVSCSFTICHLDSERTWRAANAASYR